uniref:Uncharacterized protein n=1 Tax=Echeneis naucrates TaxID=173247 RepID=A0A665VSD6_ECHNA
RHQGFYSGGVGPAGEKAQDGRSGPKWSRHHHGHRTEGTGQEALYIHDDVTESRINSLSLSLQYVFVSLLSRDSVYDVLRRICTHLQVNGKSLSLKQYLEEPSSLSMDEFPEVLKWRRKPSLPAVSSSLPDLLGNSAPGLAADTPFSAHVLTGRPRPLPIKSPRGLRQKALNSVSVCTDSSLETDKILLTEPVPELGHMEYQLMKLFILL